MSETEEQEAIGVSSVQLPVECESQVLPSCIELRWQGERSGFTHRTDRLLAGLYARRMTVVTPADVLVPPQKVEILENWAKGLGLFKNYDEINKFDKPSAISRGLAFVPALWWLGKNVLAANASKRRRDWRCRQSA